MSDLAKLIDDLMADGRKRGLSGEALKADVRKAFQAVIDRYSVVLANPHSVKPEYPSLPDSVCLALDEHMSTLSKQFRGSKVDQKASLKTLLRAIAEAIASESRKAQAAKVFAEQVACALSAYNESSPKEVKP